MKGGIYMIKVTLRDEVKEFSKGTTPADIAKEISMGLYRNLCACTVNGVMADVRTELNEDCEVNLLTFESEEGKHAFWHTASHILAQAVKRLYPETKLAIGPAIDNGFYYDFDSEVSFTPETLEKIEAEMKKIVKEDIIASTTTTAIIKNSIFSISKVFSKLASPHNNPTAVTDHNSPYIFLTQKIKLKTIIDSIIT